MTISPEYIIWRQFLWGSLMGVYILQYIFYVHSLASHELSTYLRLSPLRALTVSGFLCSHRFVRLVASPQITFVVLWVLHHLFEVISHNQRSAHISTYPLWIGSPNLVPNVIKLWLVFTYAKTFQFFSSLDTYSTDAQGSLNLSGANTTPNN